MDVSSPKPAGSVNSSDIERTFVPGKPQGERQKDRLPDVRATLTVESVSFSDMASHPWRYAFDFLTRLHGGGGGGWLSSHPARQDRPGGQPEIANRVTDLPPAGDLASAPAARAPRPRFAPTPRR